MTASGEINCGRIILIAANFFSCLLFPLSPDEDPWKRFQDNLTQSATTPNWSNRPTGEKQLYFLFWKVVKKHESFSFVLLVETFRDSFHEIQCHHQASCALCMCVFVPFASTLSRQITHRVTSCHGCSGRGRVRTRLDFFWGGQEGKGATTTLTHAWLYEVTPAFNPRIVLSTRQEAHILRKEDSLQLTLGECGCTISNICNIWHEFWSPWKRIITSHKCTAITHKRKRESHVGDCNIFFLLQNCPNQRPQMNLYGGPVAQQL